ncbi:MAG: hypothetical protein AAF518_05375 [Spirochaetota bacterium]
MLKLLVVVFLILSCTSQQGIPPKFSLHNAGISLLTSSAHQKYLMDVDKDFYDHQDLQQLFSSIRWKANITCKMIWKQESYDKQIIRELVSPASFAKEPFLNWWHPVPKLITGCWNFFKMNDMNPQRDFQIVQKNYPNTPKECYSVGFLQPYLMHYVLGCKRITMIDVDWRILDAHRQMVGLYQKNSHKQQATILDDIRKLEIGWIARFDGKPVEAKAKVDLDTICFQKNHKICKEFLLGFHKRFDEVASIQLQLSYLHLGKFFANKKAMLVIYLSNAIDDVYTTPEQFAQLLHRVKKNLYIGQTAVFIYHSAGRSRFGVYELKKQKKESFSLKTICKDIYLSTPVLKKTYTYPTYFEQYTDSQGDIPGCSSQFVAQKK